VGAIFANTFAIMKVLWDMAYRPKIGNFMDKKTPHKEGFSLNQLS
jgi:hypothetical protein